MGFHPAWKFQNVFELLIEEGDVHEIRDVSKEIERVRESMLKLPRAPEIRKANQQEIESWIEQSFRLEYDLKPWVHFDL